MARIGEIKTQTHLSMLGSVSIIVSRWIQFFFGTPFGIYPKFSLLGPKLGYRVIIHPS
jgi:hypothetical protein